MSNSTLALWALRQVCGAGVSPAWFNHNLLGRRDARTTIIRKPGGELHFAIWPDSLHVLKKRIDEFVRIEEGEILGLLADADVLHG